MRLGIFFQGLSCCFQGVYKVYKGYQGISEGLHGLLGFFKGFQDQWPMTNRSNDVILEIRCDQAGPDLSDSSWLANRTYLLHIQVRGIGRKSAGQ